jgi:hypothetical protein
VLRDTPTTFDLLNCMLFLRDYLFGHCAAGVGCCIGWSWKLLVREGRKGGGVQHIRYHISWDKDGMRRMEDRMVWCCKARDEEGEVVQFYAL